MNPERLTKAVYHIAIGFGILCFDINLGRLNILPDWLGYWLILNSLDAIAEEEPTAALLKSLGKLLLLWCAGEWVLKLIGADMSGSLIAYMAYIVVVERLYFQFQLLTNLASIAARYVPQFRQRILRLRTVMTLVVTGYALVSAFFASKAVAVMAAMVQLVSAVWLWRTLLHMEEAMTEVFGLKPQGPEPLTFAERIQMNTESSEN